MYETVSLVEDNNKVYILNCKSSPATLHLYLPQNSSPHQHIADPQITVSIWKNPAIKLSGALINSRSHGMENRQRQGHSLQPGP